MRRIWISSLLLAGCVTQPAPTPWPCDKIREVPGLYEEMQTLKDLDPTGTKLIRDYAKAASSKCAADRELGAKRISEEPLTCWTRFKRWVVREVAY